MSKIFWYTGHCAAYVGTPRWWWGVWRITVRRDLVFCSISLRRSKLWTCVSRYSTTLYCRNSCISVPEIARSATTFSIIDAKRHGIWQYINTVLHSQAPKSKSRSKSPSEPCGGHDRQGGASTYRVIPELIIGNVILLPFNEGSSSSSSNFDHHWWKFDQCSWLPWRVLDSRNINTHR